MLRSIQLLIFLGLVLSSVSSVHAASGFRVMPLRLDFGPGANTNELKLTNLTNTPMVLQVNLKEWTQENGVDKYTDSKDLFFAPPIVRVPASSETVIRFRMKVGADRVRQKSYRVFVEQITNGAAADTPTGSVFRLRFGIPAFIEPIEQAQVDPVINLERVAPNHVRAMVTNNGQMHLKVIQARIYPAGVNEKRPPAAGHFAMATNSQNQTAYVLPGSTQVWDLVSTEPFPNDARLLLWTDYKSNRPVAPFSPAGYVWMNLPK